MVKRRSRPVQLAQESAVTRKAGRDFRIRPLFSAGAKGVESGVKGARFGVHFTQIVTFSAEEAGGPQGDSLNALTIQFWMSKWQ
jgi:hypothetical protein